MLISALSFELVEEAHARGGLFSTSLGSLAGVITVIGFLCAFVLRKNEDHAAPECPPATNAQVQQARDAR